ncbi:hypothetical protein PtB15_13B113 [Puccinia triticina]|nr:hypothetical protein PtB15_13B113 [Puccinia triticina]
MSSVELTALFLSQILRKAGLRRKHMLRKAANNLDDHPSQYSLQFGGLAHSYGVAQVMTLKLCDL